MKHNLVAAGLVEAEHDDPMVVAAVDALDALDPNSSKEFSSIAEPARRSLRIAEPPYKHTHRSHHIFGSRCLPTSHLLNNEPHHFRITLHAYTSFAFTLAQHITHNV